MFGIGFWELVVIVLFILLVMGPDKIGPIARAVGRALREMRRGVDELKDTFHIDESVRDVEAIRSEILRKIEAEADEVKVEIVEEETRTGGPGGDEGGDGEDG
jgi:sec-independent protein translocase protein TatB